MQLQAIVRGQEEFSTFLQELEAEEEQDNKEDKEDKEDKTTNLSAGRGAGTEAGAGVSMQRREEELIDSDIDIDIREEEEEEREAEGGNRQGNYRDVEGEEALSTQIISQRLAQRGQGRERSDKNGIQVAKNIDRFQGTDRVRRLIQRETLSRVGVKISTSIQRQVYLAI